MTKAESRTPVSNTGLNSQNLSPTITVRVDWIDGKFRNVPTLADAYGIITAHEKTFDDSVAFRPDEPTHMGRRWDGHSTSSIRGLRFWWQKPTDHEPGQLYVRIPGQALAAATHKATHDLLSGYGVLYDFIFKRLDIAIDDFAKKLNIDLLIDAADNDNFAWCNKSELKQSKTRLGEWAKTIYFGSTSSDKMVRGYEKDKESGGEIDSFRLEGQFRRDRADIAGTRWLAIDPSELETEGAKYLASLVTGAVHFCDRTSDDPNLKRLPPLEWWADFLSRTAEGVRIPCPKRKPILDRALDWLDSQVAPTLGVVRRVFGEGFDTYLEALIGGGENRHSSRHRAMIDLAKSDGWSYV